MEFPNNFKCLIQNQFIFENYKLIPIRFLDKDLIRAWRNDQIEILRQQQVLTLDSQFKYFSTIIFETFHQDFPDQLIFSFLENGKMIGYGGLVHIDWDNKNAEISFLLATELNFENNYLKLFSSFLILIELVAKSINLNKIFTYGYNINEYRFKPLIEKKYIKEVQLSNHILINEKLYDIKIYSKILI